MNKIEAIKQEKDGLDVLPDLYRYARAGWEAIEEGDLERLKWYGLFHRKVTPGFFMLRLRIPNGVLTSEQLSAIGGIARQYGRGAADLTTRENIQLRWIRIEDAPAILQRLSAAGITTQQSGMDNVRNVMGCPVAGLDSDELLDARPLAARLQQAVVGTREFSNLPRKVNLTITGCREDCAHAQANDLSFTPATQTLGGREEIGFNVLVGGALGGRDPRLAEPLDVFTPPADVVDVARAILTVYRDHGPREKRAGARLKVLLQDWGLPRFRAAVEAALGRPLPRAGRDATPLHGGDHIGVRAQKQPGLVCVGLVAPVGRTSGEQLLELARLARLYGRAEVRLTAQQNVLIPNVAAARLDALLAEPLLRELPADPSPFVRGLVACTGMDYCHYSLIDTKGEALRLAAALEDRYEVTGPVRIQVSGCVNACGQHRIGDVGLEGVRTRQGEEIVEAAHLCAGGRLGVGARLAVDVAENIPLADLPERVAGALRAVLGEGVLRARGVAAPAG